MWRRGGNNIVSLGSSDTTSLVSKGSLTKGQPSGGSLFMDLMRLSGERRCVSYHGIPVAL
jgi:hypothetical protein